MAVFFFGTSIVEKLDFPNRVSSKSQRGLADISLSQQERDAIFRNLDHLDTHGINMDTDCFLDASKSLSERCEQMEANQRARVNAAIHLTICELKTAEHVTVPLECTEFTGSSRQGRSDGAKACVEALYRSPQFWSSYSGYLRDIPQLCFAYRRWHEIDTAKNFYRNATIEKIAVLKLMQRRQLQLSEQESRMSLRLNDMEVIEDKLRLSVTSLGARSDVLLSSLQAVISETDQRLISFKNQLAKAVKEQASAHGEQHAATLHQLLRGTEHSLGNIHSLLNELNAEAASLSFITVSSSPMEVQNLQLKVEKANAREEWPKLKSYMESFSLAVNTVNAALDTISHGLGVQSEVEEQRAVATSLVQLGTTVSQLTVIAQEHTDILNETATMARHKLLHIEKSDTIGALMGNIVQLMSFLSLFEGMSQRMSSWHLLRSASSLFQVLWYAISSTMASLLQQMITFALTSRRRQLRRVTPHQPSLALQAKSPLSKRAINFREPDLDRTRMLQRRHQQQQGIIPSSLRSISHRARSEPLPSSRPF
ncbi:hypothetical protein FRC17_001085 [Serendipita sp. 399]|nr:hypothetical protein FRC17_001085 [Serendipita sp. 399]